jgi:steroid delta-isomerase-like uncharacterized protein
MTRDEIVAFVARRERALKEHDIPALVEEHSDDCILQSPIAGIIRGREAIGQAFRAWFESFPDSTYQVDDLFVDNDRAVLVGTLAGTDLGGFMGLAPTGKRFTFPIVSMFTFKQNRIASERRIYDFTGLLLQIGTLKARPA